MNILQNDIKHTLNGLTAAERAKFNGSTVLITGCAGFLGYYMMQFFAAESEEYYDAVDTAIAAFNSLSEEEQNVLKVSIFDPETGITYAQYLADQVAAREVIERIQDIGQVVYSGDDDSLEAIEYAEAGYNALSDAQKAIVDGVNHNTLTKDRADYDAVEEVAELIELIPDAEASEEYYNAVDSAAAGYAQLTADQLAIINAATTLDYEKVLGDNVAARAVIEEIANIGTLTYDGGINDSLSKIEAAETAYDAIKDNADVKAIVDRVIFPDHCRLHCIYFLLSGGFLHVESAKKYLTVPVLWRI